ncbi:MAG: IS66 family insertion sequence element accessory protein TnpA [Burkholderiales bacterium]
MQGIKRHRLDAPAWRALLAQFASSGLTVKAFCRRERVSTASLYRWRSQLGAGSADPAPLPVTQALPSGMAGFVDLGLLGPADSRSARLELRLDLGGGVQLRLLCS